MHESITEPVECWTLRVTGVVQGVGYRPFVKTLADSLGVSGWVSNDELGVIVEARGAPSSLETFVEALRERAPVLARVDAASVTHRSRERGAATRGLAQFEIRPSERSTTCQTLVPADAHVCADCLRELFDPDDRRYRYPFVNCTNCGPRYSLIRTMPYDRSRTTMARFAMCAECRAEYESPADRRFHAQPNACPACGPSLLFREADGRESSREAALERACQLLAQGGVLGVKSVGGFHLAANAFDDGAVGELRRRKRRDGKPFAVMVRDTAAAERLAHVTRAERELLESTARPIVLLKKRDGASLSREVSPRNPNLGVMLPSAPLHYLLLDETRVDALVMTSGNVSGRPIEYDNEDAIEHLGRVTDGLLLHDRPIATRVDDSVVRCSEMPRSGETLLTFFRRSRGYAPYPVRLAQSLAPSIAYGAALKTTVSVGSGQLAYVSQHVGDLENEETREAHVACTEHLRTLLGVAPTVVACDLHPDFASTRLALEQTEAPTRVQHHHAHVAACMADNRMSGKTLGVVFDGAGHGEDGAVWGGEFLVGDYASVERGAHLRYVPLLGGDQAVREPIRMALVLAVDAAVPPGEVPALRGLEPTRLVVWRKMLEQRLNCPPTSSVGRLFDGVAALLGVCTRASYEAQGPIELEGLLQRDLSLAEPYAFEVTHGRDPLQLDFRASVIAIVRDLGRGVPLERISRRFHSTVVAALVETCSALRARHQVDQVVLSGGAFLNEFLLVNGLGELRGRGFDAHAHRLVPPDDGGISLGQLLVAHARQTGGPQV